MTEEKDIVIAENGQPVVQETGKEDRPVTEGDCSEFPGMWDRVQAVQNGQDVELPDPE